MYTEEEKKFLKFWEQNREQQKKITSQWRVGLPLSFLFITALFVNIATGWHKRAAMVINSRPSFILVLIFAMFLIFVFVLIFTTRHRWERNEEQYQRLISREGYKS